MLEIGFLVLIISGLFIALMKARKNHITKSISEQDYFLIGLFSKLSFALVHFMVYKYHFKGGDYRLYYQNGKYIGNLIEKGANTFELICLSQIDRSHEYFSEIGAKYLNYSGVYFVSKLTALFHWLGQDNLFLIHITFSILAFIGLWLFYKSVSELYPKSKNHIFLFIFLLPSIGFWASGISKESVLVLAIGLFIYSFFKVLRPNKSPFRVRLFSLMGLLTSLYIFCHVKQYVAWVFVPMIVLYCFIEFYRSKISFKHLIQALILIVGSFTVFNLHVEHNFMPKNMLAYGESFHDTNSEITKASGGPHSGVESSFEIQDLFVSVPELIFRGMLQPFIWSSRGILKICASLESLVVSIMTLWLFIKMGMKRRWDVLFYDPFLVMLVLVGSLLLASVTLSTPNLGSFVRYRMIAWLFLLMPFVAVLGELREDRGR